MVGYIAHSAGSQTWIVEGAVVQGHNIRGLAEIPDEWRSHREPLSW